ncbi:type II toxin-antitoxin system PemK/MazF family toxin [Bacillus sp. UNC438CL73TsuS30]|uniref:type II toxin-antitoxin system PemK/MazF family toxin n=1 Tax=Bacillus sp. UNC438CL73TsuS30 TaxID=1340434 RepID=UPI00047A9686|nr:type II toxin-antitoxin system PemK/MazF family toxin [Bacillus sp. UNC438CL73TsuS30]
MTPSFYDWHVGKLRVPKCLTSGLFVHAPFLFLDNPSPLILRVDTDKNPELLLPPPLRSDERLPEISVTLKRNPTDAFSEDLPEVKKLGIHQKEELVVYKAKKRPGIILSNHSFNQQSDTIFVIPTFTLDKDYISEGEKEIIRQNVHPKYFYLPASEEFSIKESFADFTQVQSISRDRILPQKKRLSNLALQALYMKQISEHTDAYSYVTKDFSTD